MPATDPSQIAAQMTAQVVAAYRSPMESLGRDMQTDMRELISVQVQYGQPAGRPSDGGRRIQGRNRSGPGLRLDQVPESRKVRSAKGEAPRKEYGLLTKSMITWTVSGPASVTTFMGSDESIADYSRYLEQLLDRPHFATIAARVERYASDRILSRLPRTI